MKRSPLLGAVSMRSFYEVYIYLRPAPTTTPCGTAASPVHSPPEAMSDLSRFLHVFYTCFCMCFWLGVTIKRRGCGVFLLGVVCACFMPAATTTPYGTGASPVHSSPEEMTDLSLFLQVVFCDEIHEKKRR